MACANSLPVRDGDGLAMTFEVADAGAQSCDRALCVSDSELSLGKKGCLTVLSAANASTGVKRAPFRAGVGVVGRGVTLSHFCPDTVIAS